MLTLKGCTINVVSLVEFPFNMLCSICCGGELTVGQMMMEFSSCHKGLATAETRAETQIPVETNEAPLRSGRVGPTVAHTWRCQYWLV